MSQPTTDELKHDVRDSFPLLFLRAILPFASAACALAGVVVHFLRYFGDWIAIYCIVLSLLFFLISKFWIPRVRSALESDWVAFTVFGLASFGNFAGAYQVEFDGSPISQAFLLILGSFVFSSTTRYGIFVVVTVSLHLVARLAGNFPLDLHYYNLLILGPVYALMTHLGVTNLRKRASTANQALKSKIDELQREKELRQESDGKLITAQKMESIGLLAAGVAHDFNNHLHAISALTELLIVSDDQPQEERSEYYQLIRSATTDAAEICSRMLAYAGKTQDRLEVLDIVDLLRRVKPILTACVSQPARVEYLLPKSELFSRVNATALQQCVTNLIQNSRDSLENGCGCIRLQVMCGQLAHFDYDSWQSFGDLELIQSHKTAEYVIIEVSDDGCGMDTKTLESMFDPYFTTKKNGHGFGLSVTLGIIRSFGGIIRCQTKLGKGTKMQILLPSREKPSPKSSEAPIVNVPKINIHQVLLVEDDDLVRQNTAELLLRAGFSVTALASPNVALARVLEQPEQFDVMLVDYAMPEMTGMEFLKRVRAQGIQTKAILCSGYAETSILNHDNCHPDAFLAKPYELSSLTTTFTQIEST